MTDAPVTIPPRLPRRPEPTQTRNGTRAPAGTPGTPSPGPAARPGLDVDDWVVRGSRVARSPVVACALAGLVVAQASVALWPEAGVAAIAGAGIRTALGAWLLLTFVQVGAAAVRGHPAGRTGEAPRVPALWVALGAAALLFAALQRAPSRLVANALGFWLLLVPVVWVVERRAGKRAAARATVAVAMLALLPTHVDRPTASPLERALPDSWFIWTAGWPAAGWVLRHEIALPERDGTMAMLLTLPLSAPYDGPGRVRVSVNGHDLGYPAFVGSRNAMQLVIPAGLIAGERRVVIDMRQEPMDPALRLMAHRWIDAGTLGAAASSFYDTQRWWPGTFNDLRDRRQSGAYVVLLEPVS